MDVITILGRLDAAIDLFTNYDEAAAGIITGRSDFGNGVGTAVLEFYGQKYTITLTPLED